MMKSDQFFQFFPFFQTSLLSLCLFVLPVFSGAAAEYEWIFRDAAGKESVLPSTMPHSGAEEGEEAGNENASSAEASAEKTVSGNLVSSEENLSVAFRMPGNALLFRRAGRLSFRHEKELFDSSRFFMRVRVSGPLKKPLKAWIFAKDKDGNWYQTEKEYTLVPGEWQTLEAVTDQAGRHFLPVGHNGAWNGAIASGAYEIGLSLYGEEEGSGLTLECSEAGFSGKRKRPPLRIVRWDLPGKIEKNRTFESRFQLSREYFNPFDPDEIEVNYEIALPGNTLPVTAPFHEIFRLREEYFNPFLFRWKEIAASLKLTSSSSSALFNLRYPAFYGQDFERYRHFTRESVFPSGAPYWAFRMIPHQSGPLRLRLHVLDRSGEEAEELFSAWREVHVEDSAYPGVIRVSTENPRFYEFTDGSFFYPVGLNIHTNTDLRSEFKFNWGHLPDRGTYDYDDYFEACGRAGINLIEIWMASWTYALEWDSARTYYYGVGRYNMANAWKLDHLFHLARDNGIYLNLVLDAHGKLSTANDQEWEDNPYNAKAAFAAANGGFLKRSQDFWIHPDAQRANWKRNRYILARWGAEAHLYAVEFWSEVNLVADGWNRYRQGYMTAWHRRAAREVRELDQGGHLMSTHICGDSGTVLSMRQLGIEPPEFTHIACNAYRGTNVHIVDQLRKHGRDLFFASKPMMIMEYGGTNFGSKDNQVRADIHGGLWGAPFTYQAGTPSLWWHDFVHIKNMYPHFLAFSKFMKGVDLRKAGSVLKEGRILLEENVPPFATVPSWDLPHARTSSDGGGKDASSPRKRKTEEDGGFRRFPHQWQLSSLLNTPASRYFERRIAGWLPASEYMDFFLMPLGSDKAVGWVYDRAQLLVYPADPGVARLFSGVLLPLDLPLEPGDYLLRFYDTLTGEPASSCVIRCDGAPRLLKLPPFRVDLGVKLDKLPGGEA